MLLLTCFASLRVVPNGILALFAIPQSFHECVEWLSLELSLLSEWGHTGNTTHNGSEMSESE